MTSNRSTVALNANAQVLVVASNEEHYAALVNPDSQKIFAKLPTGRGPHEIAVSPHNDLAFVANSGPQEGEFHSLIPKRSPNPKCLQMLVWGFNRM